MVDVTENFEKPDSLELSSDFSTPRTGAEFLEFIKFTNEEISIEDVTPVYCPNTIG